LFYHLCLFIVYVLLVRLFWIYWFKGLLVSAVRNAIVRKSGAVSTNTGRTCMTKKSVRQIGPKDAGPNP
jgi:hypothetical protein